MIETDKLDDYYYNAHIIRLNIKYIKLIIIISFDMYREKKVGAGHCKSYMHKVHHIGTIIFQTLRNRTRRNLVSE